jgi:hypothetical protein
VLHPPVCWGPAGWYSNSRAVAVTF